MCKGRPQVVQFDLGGKAAEHRRSETSMHIVIIVVLLGLAFPTLARLIGSLLRTSIWLIVGLVALAAVGTFSR
jgi:hypothetical protein